jgi:hypothetical protein
MLHMHEDLWKAEIWLEILLSLVQLYTKAHLPWSRSELCRRIEKSSQLYMITGPKKAIWALPKMRGLSRLFWWSEHVQQNVVRVEDGHVCVLAVNLKKFVFKTFLAVSPPPRPGRTASILYLNANVITLAGTSSRCAPIG